MEIVVPTEVACLHCGEVFLVQVDTSEAEQSLVEDCAVCCRPIQLNVRCRPGEILEIRTGLG
jgi:cysteine-rich CPXCG protein